MITRLDNTLVIAISSRALFNLEQSHEIYVKEGIDTYCRYQIDHENDILEPGIAFSMVKKLLAINETKNQHIEIVLISRNSADTGLRVFNSIEHYNLNINRAAFTGGESPYQYIKPFGAHLFLSADPVDVKHALDSGAAAATILPSHVEINYINYTDQLRIAFDGDAVLFSDEAEQIYQQQGLQAFTINEKQSANRPLPGGPFKNVLAALYRIQKNHSAERSITRTALITARAAPAHKRVIKTLRAWKIRIDESFFLGGMDKGKFLNTFGADIFFDDQKGHCDSARKHVATGHVPNGVANQHLSS